MYFNEKICGLCAVINGFIFKHFTSQFSNIKKYNCFLCIDFAYSSLANTVNLISLSVDYFESSKYKMI